MGFMNAIQQIANAVRAATTDEGPSAQPLDQRRLGYAQQHAAHIWEGIQQQYPQLARDAYVNFLNDAAIKRLNGQKYNAISYGGNGPSAVEGSDPRGQIVFNRQQLGMPDDQIRAALIKELGQVESKKFLGTSQRADQFLQLLGSPNANPNGPRYPSGLPNYGWNGDTSNMGPHQVSVGQARTFPEDAYGYAFSDALHAPIGGGHLDPQVMARLQQFGLVPKPPSPTSAPARQAFGSFRAALGAIF